MVQLLAGEEHTVHLHVRSCGGVPVGVITTRVYTTASAAPHITCTITPTSAHAMYFAHGDAAGTSGATADGAMQDVGASTGSGVSGDVGGLCVDVRVPGARVRLDLTRLQQRLPLHAGEHETCNVRL